MEQNLLEIKNLHVHYVTDTEDVQAVNGVNLRLKQGEVLGIVGESGSGKSVTAYSVMGLTAYPGRLVGGGVRRHPRVAGRL